MAAPERIEGSWGIEPVPERLRVLGTLDTSLLWGNLGVSLLVIVAGAALVPALSLPSALVAILIGCVIGSIMLGVAGAIGTDARVPGMVLMRVPLGRRGSYLPTGVNVLRGIGWSVWRPGLIAAWIAGFALYQWLFPTGPSWWTDLVAKLDPPEWGIGATVPSFVAAFGVAIVVAALSRRPAAGPAPA